MAAHVHASEGQEGKDLNTAKSMVSVLADGVQFIRFAAPDIGEVMATQQIAVNADEVRSKQRRFEITSFRGRLERVSLHDERTFVIYDILTDEPIDCTFSEEDIPKVAENLGRRVSVHGKACFEQGKPVSIEIAEFRGLSDDILDMSKTEGVDITGGMDSADYVRALRNGEAI